MAVSIWRTLTIAVVAGMAPLACAAPAIAQAAKSDQTAPQDAPPPADTKAAGPQTKNPDTKAALEHEAQDQKAQDRKVGTSAVVMDLSAVQGLIGKSVTSSAGEDMGRIVDLLVTPGGQVRAAVIDFGGILGVGSRKVAVDWKAISFADLPKSGSIKLALTRDQVRVSPEYKSGDPVVILETKSPAAAPAAAPSAEAAPTKPPPEAAGK